MIFDGHANIGESIYGPAQTIDELFMRMDSHDIEQAVVSPFTPPDMNLRKANAAVADAVNASGRLVGFARIDPRLGDLSILELTKCREEGICGVKVDPFEQAFRISSQRVFPFFEACAEASMPVLVSSGHPTVSSPLEVGAVAERLPNIPFLLAHGAQLAMHGLGIMDCLAVVQKFPNVYVETSAIPETGTESLIERVVLEVSPDRVIFGTNSPINHPLMEIERVLVASVPDEAKSEIFGGNLLKLLKLEEEGL